MARRLIVCSRSNESDAFERAYAFSATPVIFDGCRLGSQSSSQPLNVNVSYVGPHPVRTQQILVTSIQSCADPLTDQGVHLIVTVEGNNIIFDIGCHTSWYIYHIAAEETITTATSAMSAGVPGKYILKHADLAVLRAVEFASTFTIQITLWVQ